MPIHFIGFLLWAAGPHEKAARFAPPCRPWKKAGRPGAKMERPEGRSAGAAGAGRRRERLPSAPIGLIAVEVVDGGAEGPVAQIRPPVFVAAGRVLELLLVDVEDERPVIRRRQFHRLQRDGEELLSHAQESAEREDPEGDASVLGLDHEILDLSEILSLRIEDACPDERFRRKLGGSGGGGSGHENLPEKDPCSVLARRASRGGPYPLSERPGGRSNSLR